jgi:hypothetical protein
VSVVEKSAPRNLLAIGVAVVAVIVAVVGIVAVIDGGSPTTEPTAGPPVVTTSTRPPTTEATNTAASTAAPLTRAPGAPAPPTSRPVPVDVGFDPGATYRIYLHRAQSSNALEFFAYIDVATGELRYVDDVNRVGIVAGRFGDTLVVQGLPGLRFVDRDFARDFTGLSFTQESAYVGRWRDHAVIAEYFPERTTFHVLDGRGREVQSVALVGSPPTRVAGVVRDAIMVERGVRIITVNLTDSTVRQFAVGTLVGAGGDRVFYTSCTLQGSCSLHESTLDGPVRTNPIGPYVQPGATGIGGVVAPDGSGVVLYQPRAGGEVVLADGSRFTLSAQGGPRAYAWSPTGRLFLIDGPDRTLDAIDYRTGRVTTIALPAEVSRELASVSVW